MYLRILTKDLRRKKTMNIILLIFIILASTFISSSTNNLIVITSAMDNYLKKAELSDFLILTIKDEQNDKAITEFMNTNENVQSWSEDENLYMSCDNITLPSGEDFNMSNTALVNCFNIKHQKFFDSNNKEITQMSDGEIYMPIKIMESNNLKPKDIITITSGNLSMDFTIKDNCKDAFLGSTMMGAARFIVSESDYKRLREGSDFSFGTTYGVDTTNLKALEKDFNQMGFNFIVSCDYNLISFSYIMDMMIAGLLLVVSICLILISLVILRFTIVFTLNEEFREIGIMKAIGLKGRKIRGLYIVKYLMISGVGSAIGFLLSIPFGNMFLKKVSRNIIISNGAKGLIINFICATVIVAIVILFCYSCTRQVNKFSPIDAIRNGSNGERFKRKGLLNLNKSRLSAISFMALNDIVSGLKKFSVLILTFTIGIILVIVPIDSINTLRSDKLVTLFGMAESDAYLVNENNFKTFRANGRGYIENFLADIEETLVQNGIPATASCEMNFKYKISRNDSYFISLAEQGTDITADQYTYTEGQSPKYANEVAITHITADKIGAKIGDTVKIKTDNNDEEFIVTAIYQSMNNLGEGIRFSEKTELDYSGAVGISAIQVRYSDNPSAQVIKKRMDEIKKLYPSYEIYTGGEYISNMMGDVAGQLEGVKQLIVIVIIMINLLVAVLMEKTFITKEKGEIGMLKSLGFSNFAIIKWQAIRIGIILFISTILGAWLSNPIAQISSGKIFEMMGASRIEFEIKPFEVYVFYPFIIFVMTMAASILTALQIRRISAQETNNIE
ncbi:MAG: FtsX-like permease family protein [Herbinix sp.]|nr:FtsX-like permease family protein [Herbinix sp.]